MMDQIKLLLVEDNSDDALLEVIVLNSEGFEVVFERVETIEDFVIALGKSSWELVISDYNLVGFNGIDVLGEFKKTGIDIPFIIVSGTIGEEKAVAAMKAGAHDYVMKHHLSKLGPVVKRELLDASNRRKRKHAEEKLEYEQYLFSMLMDNIPDHIYFKDKESRFIRLNKSMLQRFGFSDLNEAIGKTDFDVFKDIHAQQAFQDEQTIIRTGEPIINLEEKETWSDGSITWVSTTKIPFYDSNGQINGTFGISRDITESKKVQEAIRESEERFKMVFENVFDGLSIYDEDPDPLKRRLIDCNQRYATMSGRTREELLGIGITKALQVTLEDSANNDRLDSVLSKIEYRGSFKWLRPDGEDNIIEYVGVPISWRGKTYTIGIDRDISERKRSEKELIAAKEKAEESNRLKTAFLATMNHELRTPLNHILGFSELILSSVSPEDNVSFASSIQTSGQSLLSIIEGIFDLAMVEQENIILRNQTFTLMDHIMESKASFDNILVSSGKNEQIKLIFKPDIPFLSRYITADRSKINQILTNLFKNAVKFTSQGTIELGFKVEKDSNLTYYVKDSGIGIPDEKQNIIFDFFRQVDDSYTRRYGGIGIGLAISQKIANILNGELKVVSEIGVGSTFSLTIPVELSDRRVVNKEK